MCVKFRKLSPLVSAEGPQAGEAGRRPFTREPQHAIYKMRHHRPAWAPDPPPICCHPCPDPLA